MTNPAHNFVSPSLCTRLMEHGVTIDTWACWREYVSGSWSQLYLVAPGLDANGLYRKQDQPDGELPPVYMDTPAYTLNDMLRCIPLFQLQQNCAMSATITTQLGLLDRSSFTAEMSFADLAAHFLLNQLQQGRLPVSALNEELLSNPLIMDDHGDKD